MWGRSGWEAVRVGAKITRFLSSPDLFLFCFPISEVFRGIAVVSARFHHCKCLHNKHLELSGHLVKPQPPTKNVVLVFPT